MRTKDEILRKVFSKEHLIPSKRVVIISSEAMQEYADQEKEKEAIEFFKWTDKRLISSFNDELWMDNMDGKTYILKELYQRFKKEKS